MKERLVNGRWWMWVPDHMADWDALSGDASLDTGWEAERFRSMQHNLHYGDTFFDIGTEHGVLSAIIAREFVGAENMVLFEPSPEFWVNIERVWRYNGLNEPLACFPGFVDNIDVDRGGGELRTCFDDAPWPDWVDPKAEEAPAGAYRNVDFPAGIDSITVDSVAQRIGVPRALNIDAEGAEVFVLGGAIETLRDEQLEFVWVSEHPDMMWDRFKQSQDDFHAQMEKRGWIGEFLAKDHEEHWLYTRANP